MTYETFKKWWWIGGIIFINIPVLIAVLSIVSAVANDPEFFTELFTEVLTRHNVEQFQDMQLKVNYLWVEAGGDMRE